jgi:predicted ATP-grasp superfamily ATP-dependent carboligase
VTRILVTDSNARSALAATRSLGRAGHFVVTAGDKPSSLAGASRFSRKHEIYPSPAHDPSGFLTAIKDIVSRHQIDVLLPMTEITTLTLANDEAIWRTGVKWPFADAHTVATAANKAAVLKLAQEVGVPIPTMVEAASAADGMRVSAALRFPVVIKPGRSRVRTESGWLSTGVSYAHDAEDLRKQLEALPPATYPVLLQERIEGPGVGVFVCYSDGERCAVFAHKRLREKPPSGGVSVLSESTAADPVAVEYADKLLKPLGWRGVAMVEFKRDLRDGSLRLMEINGRFWGSLQLAIDSGVDFPVLALQVARGEKPAPVTSYRIGLRERWLWGDVSAMLLLMTRSRTALNLPPSHPGRWRTLWEFLRFWDANTKNEVFRLDDPKPFFRETIQWVRGQ